MISHRAWSTRPATIQTSPGGIALARHGQAVQSHYTRPHMKGLDLGRLALYHDLLKR